MTTRNLFRGRGGRRGRSAPASFVALAGSLLFAAVAPMRADAPSFELRPSPESQLAVPPLPDPSTYPVQLVVDDDLSEVSVGTVQGQSAKQFLWFNRFTASGTIFLEEVWVLFPSTAGVAAGDAIEVVIFEDTDSDPANGATLVHSFLTTVQVADGNTFSIYPLGAPLPISNGDVLVGVVPRYITSGVTPLASPAALDGTTSASRSWIAVWNGDPPSPVTLPADNQTVPVGDIVADGNWMIRAFGTGASTVEIPTSGSFGLAALALLLGGLSVVAVRRRQA